MKHIILSQPVLGPADAKGVKPTLTVPVKSSEYHMIVEDDYDDTDASYSAIWDGAAKSLKVLKGDPAALTHRFAGWPDA